MGGLRQRTGWSPYGLGQQVLLVLIPAVLLLSTGFSVLLYHDLNQAITRGLDRLLIATSTLSAAQIGAELPPVSGGALLHRDLSAIGERLGLSGLSLQVADAREHPIIAHAIDGGHPPLGTAPSVVTSTEHGERRYGLAPVEDGAGRVVAVVSAEIDARVMGERARTTLVLVLVLSLAAVCLGFVVAWLIARRLSRPLQQLHALAVRASEQPETEDVTDSLLTPELHSLAVSIDALRAHLRQLHSAARGAMATQRETHFQNNVHTWLRERAAIRIDPLSGGVIVAQRPFWALVWLDTPALTLSDAGLVQWREQVDLIDLMRRVWERCEADPTSWAGTLGTVMSPLLQPGEGTLVALNDDGRMLYLAGDALATDSAAALDPQRGAE